MLMFQISTKSSLVQRSITPVDSLQNRSFRKSQCDIDDTRCSQDMRQRPRRTDIKDVRRVVSSRGVSLVARTALDCDLQEDFADDVQSKQVDHRLVARRHRLRKSSAQGEAGKHLHEVGMR